MNEQLTTVYLTDADAILFVEFQKRKNLLGLLNSIKAFDIRSGSVTINFDKVGKIVSLERHEHLSLT